MSGFRLLACAAPLTLEGLPACEKAMQLRRLQMTVQLISIVLLYYDYLLTLKDEIRYVWFGKFKPTDMVQGCRVAYTISSVLSIFGHFGIIAVWTSRTYAVYHTRRRVVGGFLCLLGAVILILLIIRTPFVRCHGDNVMPGSRSDSSMHAVLRSFCIRARHLSNSFVSDVILAQGVLYISGVALLSISVLVLNWKAWSNAIVIRLLNGLKLPLSGFLTARFILALRAAQAPNDDENSDGLPSFVANGNAVRVGGRSPIRFSTPVPSIFDEFQQDLGLGSERHSACDAVYVEHSSRNTLQKRREENPDIEEGFVQGCSRDFESASSSESPCRDVSSSSVVKQSSSAPEPSGVLGHTPTSAVWPDSASLRNRTKAGPSSSL
ncbi:hypothetical protein CC2G_003244 [Coprinopsis cinerea AmutBmut pab1-1]|nr:hypothetical protein CC2G_003244 [Coprinopsis cinerea AmutBmut pab1-1]